MGLCLPLKEKNHLQIKRPGLGFGATARDLTIHKLPQALSLMLFPTVKVLGDFTAFVCVKAPATCDHTLWGEYMFLLALCPQAYWASSYTPLS